MSDEKKPVFEIECKRFYIPGVVVKATCPKCGIEVVQDFGERYLSFPEANKPFNHGFYHETGDGEDHEFEAMLLLTVSLEKVSE